MARSMTAKVLGELAGLLWDVSPNDIARTVYAGEPDGYIEEKAGAIQRDFGRWLGTLDDRNLGRLASMLERRMGSALAEQLEREGP